MRKTTLTKMILLSCTLVLGFGLSDRSLATTMQSDQVQSDQVSHVLLAQSASSNSYTSKTRNNGARQAAAAARSEVGGRVISVKPGKDGAGFRVRMLVEGGRVITVRVDSQGRVVNDR